MDTKQMAKLSPALGTGAEIAAALERLASIPKLDFYQKKISCSPMGFGRKEGDHGHILIQSLSGDNVVEGPIGAIEVDAASCDTLIRALFSMRRQLRVLANYRAQQKQ